MEANSDVVRLRRPDAIDDPLTAVLRAGARHFLAQGVGSEVEAFLAERAGLRLPDGRARLVRHGHAPERAAQTGIGAVAVARPKVRDRGAGAFQESFADPVRRLWPASAAAKAVETWFQDQARVGQKGTLAHVGARRSGHPSR